MALLFPSPTSTWRNDTYPEISPSRPELNVNGKTVIIVGAGSGIGRETAVAFSLAGAKKLVLIGRNVATLEETKICLPASDTECLIHPASMTDAKEMKRIAEVTGTWDILIIAAGFLSTPASIKESDLDDWWEAFETNVKGTMIVSKVFSPTSNPSHAALIGMTSGTNTLPSAMLPGLSAYQSSKLAQVKVLEFVAAENPNMFVASLHPGIVRTLIFDKSGATEEGLPMDKMQLPAHFTVWLTSPEAAFLKGRLVWANWDAKELIAQAEEIQSSQKLMTGCIGWPFQQ